MLFVYIVTSNARTLCSMFCLFCFSAAPGIIQDSGHHKRLSQNTIWFHESLHAGMPFSLSLSLSGRLVVAVTEDLNFPAMDPFPGTCDRRCLEAAFVALEWQ